MSGAFVVNGSPTKTEISDSAGGRSQVGNIVAVAFVAVLLLFFTGPLQYMPTPTLCAIVFVIGLRLINFKNMKRIYSLKRSEFTLALLTASVVITVGAAQGIIFAMALALLQHVRRSYKPNNSLMLLQKRGDQTIWTWQPVASQAQTLPGLVVYHFAASLYYANARVFGEEVTALAGNIPGLRCLLLDFSAIADVDFTGGEMITEVCRKLLGKNISVRCARIENHVMQQLTAYGFIDVVKPENIHSHIEAAMAQFEAAENGRG